jgi:hypothetical protein
LRTASDTPREFFPKFKKLYKSEGKVDKRMLRVLHGLDEERFMADEELVKAWEAGQHDFPDVMELDLGGHRVVLPPPGFLSIPVVALRPTRRARLAADSRPRKRRVAKMRKRRRDVVSG